VVLKLRLEKTYCCWFFVGRFLLPAAAVFVAVAFVVVVVVVLLQECVW